MNRSYKLAFGIFLLALLFFAGINHFEGDRLSQSGVALWYAVAMFAFVRWNRRTPTG